MSIRSALEEVRRKIDKLCMDCGRNPAEIMLIAVSKTVSVQTIAEAADAGQIHFGENKVQEMVSKMEHFGERLEWHMIGALQTNKIKYIANRADWIHSVSRVKELDEIEKRAAAAGRVINILLQVNISSEDQKSGCDPEVLPALLEHSVDPEHIRVRGLMGMASLTEDAELIRSQFRQLRRLRDDLRHHPDSRINLEHLSMGMSSDMHIAIEEGSTMVRVGTAIFGHRNYE
jgi:PLP dependent protein